MAAFITNRRDMEAMLDVAAVSTRRRLSPAYEPAQLLAALRLYSSAHMANKGGMQFGNSR